MIAVRGLVHRLSSSGSRPRVLLDGVDLSLERGEIVLVTGRNGSGKTTLARYMAGLLLPSQGTVTVDGIPTDQDPRQIRRRVGLLFQESHKQIIAQTPLEDVAFGLENLALAPETIQARAWQALERVGLKEKALSPIETLTPAERQRVALAGILAMDPAYYILDEPDRTADHDGIALLLSLVRELRSQHKGVLIISHKAFWREHADRVVDLTPDSFPSSPVPLPPEREGYSGEGQEGFHLYAQDLSLAYTEAPVLRDLSVGVTAGEFIVMTGPAGSGKTTLVELLAGLVQPTSGCVTWNGTPIHTLPARERVRHVGLVFQEPYQQLLGESVTEELLLGLRAQGLGTAEAQQRARWACEAVGLDWDLFGERSSHHLSVGEQARLAIAAVLAIHPRVLILDETLAALDPPGQADLLALLQRLHSQGTTVILVTSENTLIRGTRLWQLDGGRLLYDGPLEES